MSALETGFYVTGGTLRHDSPSYVERQADKDLLDGLLKGEFCYVLTSRQMGKSSLMVRTATKLREKRIHVIALDLTAIGQNLTSEQWYDGLILRMGGQLRLEDELEDFWYDHLRLSPVQRFFSALREVVLPQTRASLVIFVDELDFVRSLPFSTDEFFAAVRECYNRRTEDAEFSRLTFCLLGVATPSDLIRDTRTTPFNIGRRIELTDFTPAEAEPLARGLAGSNAALDASQSKHLLARILYCTGGHPYLTQRLCQAAAEENSKPDAPTAAADRFIDSLCEALFFSNRARERDDNLIFVRERLLRSEVDRASLLDLYLKVRRGKLVPDDETNALVSVLRLSGIVKAERGLVQERNRIYHEVFDRDWVRAHMPDAELRRQEAAFRRGVLRTTAIAVVVVAVMTLMVVTAMKNATVARKALAQSYFSQARAWRTTGVAGQRYESLEALRQARRDYPDEAALRDEAIACLALTDLKPARLGSFALNRTKVVALSPDSRTAAEVEGDETLAMRDVKTGDVLSVLPGPGRQVHQVQFSPADTILAVAGRRGSEERLEVWNWRANRLLFTAAHGVHARAIDFSPDGSKLAVGLRRGSILVYALPSGALIQERELRLPSRFPRAPQVIRFDPSGKLIAESCLDDLNVQIWNVESGECVAKFYHPDLAYDLSWHPRGEFLAVACGDSSVYLWKPNQPESARKILTGHEGPVVSVAFNRRGGLLASLSQDETVRLWNPAIDRHLIHRLPGEIPERLWFGRDDGLLVAARFGSTNAQVWEVLGEEYRVLRGSSGQVDHFRAIDFSPDGRLLIGVTGEQATIWNASSGSEFPALQLTNAQVGFFAGDGNDLVVSTQSGLFGFPVGRAVSHPTLAMNPGTPRKFAQIPEELGTFVLTSDRRTAAIVHQAEVLIGPLDHPASIRELELGQHYQRLAIHPDKLWLAATTREAWALDLWDLSKTPVIRPQAPIPTSEFFAFSPDGRWLVICRDGEFQFYRVGDWKKAAFSISRKTGSSHHAPIAFTKNGAIAALAYSRHTIQLHQLPLGDSLQPRLLATLESPDRSALEILVFSPDDTQLAAATKDQAVQVWSLRLIREGLAALNLARDWPAYP